MKRLLLIFAGIAFFGVQVTGAQMSRVDNLEAFARVMGYVQYFHPADNSQEANWDAFVVTYYEDVAQAETADSLVAIFERIFAPYAPTMQFATAHDDFAGQVSYIEGATGVMQYVHTPTSTNIGERKVMEPVRFQQEITGGTFERSATFQRMLSYGQTISDEIAIHDPLEPFVMEFDAGIQMAMPLSVFVRDGQTLPVIEPDALPFLLDVDSLSLENRGIQLANVISLWNAMQHQYYYWDTLESVRDVDWDGVLREAITATMGGTTVYEHYQIVQSMGAALNDGHVWVMPPAAYQENWIETGLLPGEGYFPFTWAMVEGRLSVTTVFAGSPLREGDVVLAVNGVTIEEYLQAQQQYRPDTNWGIYRALSDLLNTYGADSVAMTIERYGSGMVETLDVRSSNQKIWNQREFYHREYRPDAFAHLGDNIYYLDMTRLDDDAFAQSMETLEQAGGAEGLVVDMRGYPVGRAPVELLGAIAGRELSSAPFLVGIVVEPDHQNIQFQQLDTSSWVPEPLYDVTDNVAFMTNRGAISYSESILGIVEGYGLGEIVGEATAGANGNVALHHMVGGMRMAFTSLRVTKFGGSPLLAVGVTPTIPVERTRDAVANRVDEYLLRAFEAVGGRNMGAY